MSNRITYKNDRVVAIQTNKGLSKIRVFCEAVPRTAANFLDLVERRFYNGVTFHRFVAGHVIQGGDQTGTGHGGFIDDNGIERTIPLEVYEPEHNTIWVVKHNAAGIVGMARWDDPDSASSQFYITLAPRPHLDGKYAIFGQVIEGMDVVESLRGSIVNGKAVGDTMLDVALLGNIVASDSGLLYEELTAGDGAKLSSCAGEKVTVHYTVRRTDGKKIDSSRDGEPFSFVTGRSNVKPGFEEGVAGMRVGGRRKLYVPDWLAYGEQEFPPDGDFPGLPKHSLLVFEVELLGIEPAEDQVDRHFVSRCASGSI